MGGDPPPGQTDHLSSKVEAHEDGNYLINTSAPERVGSSDLNTVFQRSSVPSSSLPANPWALFSASNLSPVLSEGSLHVIQGETHMSSLDSPTLALYSESLLPTAYLPNSSTAQSGRPWKISVTHMG